MSATNAFDSMIEIWLLSRSLQQELNEYQQSMDGEGGNEERRYDTQQSEFVKRFDKDQNDGDGDL